MILYIDSSAILRRLLSQAGALEEDEEYSILVTSALSEVECLRSVDRLRLRERMEDGRATALREGVFRLLEGIERVEITPALLGRASQPMPTALGTLDAIHLATAQQLGADVHHLVTYDDRMADAAKALGIRTASPA